MKKHLLKCFKEAGDVVEMLDHTPSYKSELRKKKMFVDAWKRIFARDGFSGYQYCILNIYFNAVTYNTAEALTWKDLKVFVSKLQGTIDKCL